jgi:hypothetical protein
LILRYFCRDDFSSKYLQENQEKINMENCRFEQRANLGKKESHDA